MNAFKVIFKDVKPIWEQELWPNRKSAIEPMSVMTWPFEGSPEEYDMSIMEKYEPTFIIVDVEVSDRGVTYRKLVGVNSGHRTSDMHYRSRGIWVDPKYRKKGVAQTLFLMTAHQGKIEGCEMIWSLPRKTALSAYTNFGFETVGDFIETETSDSNIYVKKIL